MTINNIHNKFDSFLFYIYIVCYIFIYVYYFYFLSIILFKHYFILYCIIMSNNIYNIIDCDKYNIDEL